MKSLYEVEEYIKEIKAFSKSLDKEFLRGKSIVISGATGLICSYLIDALLIDDAFDVKIVALVLTLEDGKKRFTKFIEDPRLSFVIANVINPIHVNESIDYAIHGASYTDPKGYAEHPIDTMLINFNGVKNMLDLAVEKKATKFLFMSSCEIYGESEIESIPESYTGQLDTMDVRSCYNEGKRASETLCVCYSKEKAIPVVVPRFSRCFGPTMRISDTKALSQFMKNVLEGNDVVLKSSGMQKYSYLYVSDAASAIVFLLKNGADREAYNITNSEVFELRELAELISSLAGKKVAFDIPIETNVSYSRATKAIQSTTKIREIGWKHKVSLHSGMKKTLRILKKAYFSESK